MAQKKKLQIFVSSTYKDLQEDRQAAVQAILTAKHIPAGMELFTSGDESQMNVIKRWIDESDIYLLILGGRYGSVEPKSGKSYTHLEFDYAVQQGKALFSVVINDAALQQRVKDRGHEVIETDNKPKLIEFRKDVESNMVRYWDDAKDIKIAVLETLSEYGDREGLIGWIPGNESVDTGGLAEEMARLARENTELEKQNAELHEQLSKLAVEKKQTQRKAPLDLPDSDYIILLSSYIEKQGMASIRTRTALIIYAEADKALNFPLGTSKRIFQEALEHIDYFILSNGESMVQIKKRR